MIRFLLRLVLWVVAGFLEFLIAVAWFLDLERRNRAAWVALHEAESWTLHTRYLL